MRTELGIGADDEMILVAFRSQSAPELALPAGRARRVFVLPCGWSGAVSDHRRDIRVLGPEQRFETAVAAADVVVGKPGYGLLGDVEAAARRFLYVSRPGFPENEVLEQYLRTRPGSRGLQSERLATLDWQEDLDALLGGSQALRPACSGAERAAAAIANLLDSGCSHRPLQGDDDGSKCAASAVPQPATIPLRGSS